MNRDLTSLRVSPKEPKPSAEQIVIATCLGIVGFGLLFIALTAAFSLYPYLR